MPVFAAAIFTSAFLLFWVQPLFSKMILPLLGGAPSVWIGSMLFFQATLLAGYGYTHVLTSKFRVQVQVLIHGVLLIAAGLTLPPPTDLQPPAAGDDPVLWLLRTLAITVGLPFLVVATTSPLVQVWFGRARPGASPYRLFALSNLASMLALVGYPFMLEPWVATRAQAIGWSAAYGAFVVLCAFAGWTSLRSARHDRSETLAGISGRAGISISALSKIENGQTSTSYDILKRLCDALGVGLEDIVSPGEKSQLSGRKTTTRAGEGDHFQSDQYDYRVHASEISRKAMVPLEMVVRARTVEEFRREMAEGRLRGQGF